MAVFSVRLSVRCSVIENLISMVNGLATDVFPKGEGPPKRPHWSLFSSPLRGVYRASG
jgi:hypothetical protein